MVRSLADWATSSGEDSIPKRIAALEARVRELTSQRNLEAASIGGGGLRSSNFDGVLDPAAAGTSGWGLSGTSGNAIFNNLVLRGGIIGNDALTNPITPKRLNTFTSTFSVTSTFADKVSDYVSVPDGFTSCLLLASGNVSAVNNTASAGLLQVRLSVTGFPGAQAVSQAPANSYAEASNSYATLLGGAVGGALGSTIPVSVQAATASGTWSPVTGSNNIANMSVLFLFFR